MPFKQVTFSRTTFSFLPVLISTQNLCSSNSCPQGHRCQTGFTDKGYRCVATNKTSGETGNIPVDSDDEDDHDNDDEGNDDYDDYDDTGDKDDDDDYDDSGDNVDDNDYDNADDKYHHHRHHGGSDDDDVNDYDYDSGSHDDHAERSSLLNFFLVNSFSSARLD